MHKVLEYTFVASAGFAAVYLAWVGTMRHAGNVSPARTAIARTSPATAVPDPTASSAVQILQFYASTGQLTRGDQAIVCYGVANARSVRIEPRVDELSPAMNRCFSISPRRTTTYTLFVQGTDGKEVSASFTVHVLPPPPNILFVSINKDELQRGEPLMLCYGVKNATEARLEPFGLKLGVSEKRCMRTLLPKTTELTLVALSADGRTDREKFTVRVK